MELPYPTKPNPIWIRDKQAIALFSLSRTKLWELSKRGKIKSVSLQEPGMARATRLFNVESIANYIESFLPKDEEIPPNIEEGGQTR